ncbi:hypothetical protein Sinac_6942 [Singulisphaera acidiphila DSM 18658]|uniref:Lipoprotein n=1 Tax=Singulisphaera acidiphila (strain ATCC BAA-1392 / DSM 18658 / VKM B-2454 / MOB10) TaxID=886293 RepID=L0DQ65_SINAD|nr:hypothetical protein Sinac_6942 [Singulisphaera acidiphila DSM 18658]
MRHAGIRWSLVLAACAFIGCGPAGGIQPGIPSDTTPAAPKNPTPDMEPNPKPAKI